VQSKARRN